MGEPAIPSEKDQEQAIQIANDIWQAILNDRSITNAAHRHGTIEQVLWLLAGTLLISIGELDDEEGDDEDDE